MKMKRITKITNLHNNNDKKGVHVSEKTDGNCIGKKKQKKFRRRKMKNI